MPKSTKAAPTHQSTLQGMWGKKDKEATEPAKVIPDERKINMDVDGSSAEKGEWLQIWLGGSLKFLYQVDAAKEQPPADENKPERPQSDS